MQKNFLTVILIDNDLDDLEFLKETIASIDSKINCMSFEYPIEAVRVISDELVLTPDYIFTDVNMPLMGGEEVVEQIRQNEKFNDTEIVVLSTSISPEVEGKFKELGVNFVFQKPVKFADYHRIVSHILGKP
jgi:CheY-like chemotaxis protein